MKRLFLAHLWIQFFTSACGETKSVSQEFLKSRESSDTRQVIEEEPKEGEDKNKVDPSVDGNGDSASGKKIHDTACVTCHVKGGLAKSVVLDSKAIDRLTEAYSGKNKDNHVPYKASFEGENLEDLKAFLRTVK